MSKSKTIDTLLNENRHFAPSEEFVAQANINSQQEVDEAHKDWQAWWANWAKQLQWDREWDTVLDWQPPVAKWFDGGQLNASVQCLDRHVDAGNGQRIAYYWEGEPG
ncbi:MAG: acetyl-coenzyme A synthetase N-terminal domain-containing protein, partial [Planctomycetota bacterium]|nr:acetyl-coenzyme A synthetase N-terminal domain-containing protein [Planctomycetota bacterium]